MMLDNKLQFLLNYGSKLDLLLIGIQNSTEVFPNHFRIILVQQIDDHSQTDDRLLSEAIDFFLLSQRNQSFNVDLIDIDVALED